MELMLQKNKLKLPPDLARHQHSIIALVREPDVAHELPDIFDGLSSSELAGNGKSVTLFGTTNPFEPCPPA